MSIKKSLLARLALVLALALLTAGLPGVAEEAAGATPAPTPTPDPETLPTVHVERDSDHLTVANTTAMSGNFFTDMWGNGSADIDTRALLYSYDLIRWDGERGMFELDPSVVSGVVALENDAGDRTYTLVLYDDLFYSDGAPVTAWDYAFSLLFQMSGEAARLGGRIDRRESLLGSAEYARRAMPLMYTDLVRVDGDGNITDDADPAETALAERVLKVRIPGETPQAEPGLADFADLDAGEGVELVLESDGCLAVPENGIEDEAAAVSVSPEGVIRNWRYREGVRVFEDGSHPALPGMRVLADDTLQFTISHEYLPDFYELALLALKPYPIGEIAPGAEVRDDGEGVYLANRAGDQPEGEAAAESGDADAPRFCVEALERTLLDPETGYLRNPRVVTGPYRLTGFDGTTAEFELNPRYKGDVDGVKPTIERLTYTLADNDTMVEKLATGEYDLLNKVAQTDAMNEAMTLLRNGQFRRTEATLEEPPEDEAGELWRSEDGFRMSNYPRTGLSYICFRCDRPAVSSAAVRQAIAWCMDRDAVTKDYTGGSGMRADGYYGMGQWMMGIITGTTVPPVQPPEDPDDAEQAAAYDAEMAEWEELNLDGLTVYGVDLDKARALLAGEGWKRPEDGEGLLEKDGEALDLTLIYPAGNAVAESLEVNLAENLAEVGVGLTLVPVPMGELLDRYYRRSDAPVELPDGSLRQPDMIYLATNFDAVFDPAPMFAVSEDGAGLGYVGIDDGELYRLALEMRRTEAGEVLDYMKKWIAFEERFNEVLPMIPVYTNVYFDFYAKELENYRIDITSTWGEALAGARIVTGEEPTPEPTAIPEAGEDTPEPTEDGELVEFDD